MRAIPARSVVGLPAVPPVSSSSIAERLLSEVEAAEYLSLSVRTLQQWRLTGGGPAYSKLGRRVRYSRFDLEGFVAANRRAHTSGGRA